MLNENIRKLRKAKNYSQEELAMKVNVVRQTVSKWEKGVSAPDAEMLIKIAEALDTDVNTLLGEVLPQAETSETVSALAEKLELLSDEIAEQKEKKRKIWKGVFIAIGVLALLNLMCDTLKGIFSCSVKNSIEASESIIGGADGPTAIFVSSIPAQDWSIILTVAAMIIAAIGIFKTKRK